MEINKEVGFKNVCSWFPIDNIQNTNFFLCYLSINENHQFTYKNNKRLTQMLQLNSSSSTFH